MFKIIHNIDVYIWLFLSGLSISQKWKNWGLRILNWQPKFPATYSELTTMRHMDIEQKDMNKFRLSGMYGTTQDTFFEIFLGLNLQLSIHFYLRRSQQVKRSQISS